MGLTGVYIIFLLFALKIVFEVSLRLFYGDLSKTVCQSLQNTNYVPPTEGGGAYCFWCGSRLRRRQRCFVSVRYLLNRWMDFDQTCTDTLLGGPNELIRFW